MRFAIVAFLDDVALETEFDAGELPLHVTLLGPSETEADLGQVEAAVDAALAQFAPFEVEGGDEELFGPRRDVEVTLVEHDGDLAAAHLELLAQLRQLDGVRVANPEYVGRGYRPHVTATADERIERGERFELDAIAILDLAPDGDRARRRVVAQFPLL